MSEQGALILSCSLLVFVKCHARHPPIRPPLPLGFPRRSRVGCWFVCVLLLHSPVDSLVYCCFSFVSRSFLWHRSCRQQYPTWSKTPNSPARSNESSQTTRLPPPHTFTHSETCFHRWVLAPANITYTGPSSFGLAVHIRGGGVRGGAPTAARVHGDGLEHHHLRQEQQPEASDGHRRRGKQDESEMSEIERVLRCCGYSADRTWMKVRLRVGFLLIFE